MCEWVCEEGKEKNWFFFPFLPFLERGKVMEEMKPCPFCGSESVVVRKQIEPSSWVSCLICGALGPDGKTPEDAIVKWNEARRGE